jgi:voltage-gated potassium channel
MAERRRTGFLSEPLDAPQRLYFGGNASVRRALVARLLTVFGLLAFVCVLFWLERDGLRDNLDEEVSWTDVIYFAAVSVTTTGYGDIVPVTDRSRLIDAAVITPIRLLLWMIFFGTAYQLLIQRTLERVRIRMRQGDMKDHVVICGYGNGGESAATELVNRGTRPECIVIVDRDEVALHVASERGHVGLRGDATQESVLLDARVDSARAVIVNLEDDPRTVLSVLTVRHLAPRVRILARVVEEENEKLLKQSGANVTLQSARLGGMLLANAVDGPAVLDYVCDLVSASGNLRLHQRGPRPDEIGKPPGRGPDGLVVRIVRGDQWLPFWHGDTLVAADDILVVLGAGKDAPSRPGWG